MMRIPAQTRRQSTRAPAKDPGVKGQLPGTTVQGWGPRPLSHMDLPMTDLCAGTCKVFPSFPPLVQHVRVPFDAAGAGRTLPWGRHWAECATQTVLNPPETILAGAPAQSLPRQLGTGPTIQRGPTAIWARAHPARVSPLQGGDTIPGRGWHVAHTEFVSENRGKGRRREDGRAKEGVGPGLRGRRGGGAPLLPPLH